MTKMYSTESETLHSFKHALLFCMACSSPTPAVKCNYFYDEKDKVFYLDFKGAGKRERHNKVLPKDS